MWRRAPVREQRVLALSDHVPEIDWLKGFAILCVIAIHAQFLEGSWIYRHLIDRAVLILMVLFGISSELWWQRQQTRLDEPATRKWYWGRFNRILPGYWAMMAIWWIVVTLWHPPEGAVRLSWPLAIASFLGYAPCIGETWFVTMILVYILVFPALRRAVTVLTWPVSLAIAGAVTWWTGYKMFDIVDVGKALLGDNIQWPGWYYHWVFAPRALFNVVAGIFVARFWKGRLSLGVTLLAVGATLLGEYASVLVFGDPLDPIGPIRELAVIQVVDVPLALALLGLLRWVPLPNFLRRFLGWCGLWSWGIYLGHMLVHEIEDVAGYHPAALPTWSRAVYVVFLFFTGVPLAIVADWFKRRFLVVRRRALV